jgi:hypothetical protein
VCWRFVQADEVGGDGDDEVGHVAEDGEEPVGPEGCADGDAAVGGVVGEGDGELLGFGVLGEEDLVVALFVAGPGLVVELGEVEEFVGGALEVELVLLGVDDLGEVAVGIAEVEYATVELDSDDSGCSADSGRLVGGQDRVLGQQAEALEDAVEQMERGWVGRFEPATGSLVVGLEGGEEGAISRLLLEAGAAVVENLETAAAVEVWARD